MEKIPVLDLQPEIHALRDELQLAFSRVLQSGQFILGPEVAAFEQEMAGYLGVTHCIGVASGTDALTIALRAAGIGDGDEVITTPFTFFATAESIVAAGATPVFIDIEPRTFNLDPSAVAAAITRRTRAVVPVHLYGQADDMTTLDELARQHDLRIIEDTAQAQGGTWQGRQLGTLGLAGAFSFFPSKTLGGFGDGGLVATDDPEVAETARMLRAHGARRKYFNETMGYNSRLAALQAALLRVKLPRLDENIRGRAAAAARYDELLGHLPGVTTPYVQPKFPPHCNEAGGGTPNFLYSSTCRVVCSPTCNFLPGTAKHSMTSNSSSTSCNV